MNPDCSEQFVTYNKNQFSCSKRGCVQVVANIRRQYVYKMRRFLGLCRSCGAEAFGNPTCARCLENNRDKLKSRREKWKNNGWCQECGSKNVMHTGYVCKKCYEKQRKRKGKGFCQRDGCNNQTPYNSRICDNCIDIDTAKKNICKVFFLRCDNCGKLFTSSWLLKKYCSDWCVRESQLVKNITRECEICGKEYDLVRGTTYDKFCSDGCRKKRKKQLSKISKRQRRAKKYTDNAEKIDISIVFKRDGGICHLCGRKLSLKTKTLHRREPTIDHIIPLSMGGEHTYQNVQLACRICNSRKGNRSWNRAQQLRLC